METQNGEPQMDNEITLQEGLKSYPLPELGNQNPRVTAWKDIIPPTPEEAQNRINQLLASIEKQGGELIGIINVGVSIPPEPNGMRKGSTLTPQTFLIVRK